ncbi:MAG TPA: hypothetical protein PLT82_07720 [Candidatus Hydrogenedens sp.]|nr:hypothetical protein [Candidatus Hydrogenedens sp.]HOK09464.1 hypothetical protein [Candidatus Hydrogenedens sp.]HOL18945.1 hypothetical protein [Candidatus Hydrogenedens sp.]HPP59003.1 hypothetical protein [Candidatus Hydrogenedens sp.]
MKRIKSMTSLPRRAQQQETGGGFCTKIESDYQAFLCFLLEVLTGFFLPLAEIKKPQETNNSTQTSETGS